MHQVLVKKHCEQRSQPIICKSVVDLSLEAKSRKRTLKLSECLFEILKRNRGKKIDVLVDELDSEDLDKEEVDEVNTILDEPEFQTSKIVIAFQSCQKKRRYQQGDKVKKETGMCYIDLDGFRLFPLMKSMRFTSSICSTLRSCQETIENKVNTYFCPSFKPNTIEEKLGTEQGIAHEELQEMEVNPQTEKQKVDITNQQVSLSDFSSDPTIVQEIEPTLIMDQPTMTFDASFRGYEIKGSDSKIISHFEYIKAKGSGNNIKGEIPNLLRLYSNKNVKQLTYFIDEYLDHNNENKWIIICNTEEMVNLAKASLEMCNLSFIKYTDDIDGNPPKSTYLKEGILKEWQNNKDVLLVDSRGCRGMECQEVGISVSNKKTFWIYISNINSLLRLFN